MIIASDAGARIAGIIREELGKEVDLFSVSERSGCVRINSITDFTLRHFGDYELFPSLISLSPLPSSHREAFQRLFVRSSSWFYPTFNLLKGRSQGFASTTTN